MEQLPEDVIALQRQLRWCANVIQQVTGSDFGADSIPQLVERFVDAYQKHLRECMDPRSRRPSFFLCDQPLPTHPGGQFWDLAYEFADLTLKDIGAWPTNRDRFAQAVESYWHWRLAREVESTNV